ncbi:MAG: helix-turn-helix transcriptional regulator [Lachnospiraceae bacterium]|nr:helix-turn-helix transcriptional regulator [Lachnospiraceae bacterium]
MKKETQTHPFPTDPDRIVSVKTETEGGYYINTFYPFLPGMILFLNDVHTATIPTGTFHNESDIFLLNYCISGRCEFQTDTDCYRYLTDNNLSLSGYVVRESFFYPTGYYVGFELGIVEELFTKKTYDTLREFDIDIQKIRNIDKRDDGLLIIESNSELQKIWLEMYSSGAGDPALIKLNMLKILRILTASEPVDDDTAVYLTKGQMNLAKAVQKRLTQDISVHISMREIAEELGVSESSLKKYFKVMFDMNVSEYMRIIRLKKAAKLLTETDRSILDIAAVCGYTNQGRFAKIFKEYYGMRPLEYRHVSTLLASSVG